MVNSIRWRIQLWHGLILIVVVVAFGALLYVRVQRARFDEIDTELQGAAQALVSVLRALPPHELDGPPRAAGPPRRPGPPPFEDPLGLGDRPRPPREDSRPGPPDPRRPPPREDDGHDPELPGSPGFHLARVREMLELPAGLSRRFLGPDEIAPYFVVWRPDGEVLKASAEAPATDRPDDLAPRDPDTTLFRRSGELREAYLSGPHGTLVLVGRSVRRELNELRHLLWTMVAGGGALLALGVGGGFWLSHRALAPIQRISDTAAAISASNLSQRIDTTSIDAELAELATTLNETFERLESEFLRQARFTADASHELRTPLTIILGHLELAIAQMKAGRNCSEAVEACQRAAKRMKALVEGLLLLARADAGKLEPEQRLFDMAATVEECVELLQPLAREKQVSLSSEIAPAEFSGDPRLIGQVVINLVTNAIQHTPGGGRISVTLTPLASEVVLAVADTGAGIPESHRAHVFDRFYRVDEARARDSGGLGLGLAIARSLVVAHHGEITFTSQVGQGTEFVVRMPRNGRHEAAVPLVV